MFKISNSIHQPSTPNPLFVMAFQDGMAINQKRDRRADELICAKVKPHFSCVLYALRRNNSNRSGTTLIPHHSGIGFMMLLASDMPTLQLQVTHMGII